MDHSVEMQSGSGQTGTPAIQDQTETEVRVPAKIDFKSVLAGFSSGKKKVVSPSAATPFNDVTSSLGSTSTSASTKSQPTTPTPTRAKPAPLSASAVTTTTPLSSSPSPLTTTATTTSSSPTTVPAATTVSSISTPNDTGDNKEGAEPKGESQTEEQEEPFVMTPAYERLAKLLARKRENAAAAAARTVASGSGGGVVEVDNDTLPQQSHWSKLRTTVQIASVVKQRSKRRFHHHRQDSFLRKFSTRHNTNIDQDSDSEDNEATTQEMEKEVEQKRLYRYVISPEGTFMMYWLFILTLAVLYNLWTCIAREAFREIQLEYTSFWISFDVACDLIYLADIVVQFRTGYLEQGLLVYDSRKLAKNYYTSTDFKLDVSCLLPLDLIQLTLGWHPILRFPRFLKIHRTFRCMYMLESRTPYPNLFRVANLTHILFLGAHWFAAFFYLISEAENFVGAWTYPKPVGEFAGVTRKYLYSLFWSTLTLTTIGDLPPPTTNWDAVKTGFVFVIFSYLIGVFIFATIVGQVGNVITNRNASRQEFEKLLDGAKFYMQSHNVPKELQKRVQRWYDYVWSRGRLNGSLDIGSLGMLPDKLKTELALNVNLDTLKKVTIFQECQPEFLHDLVLKMRAHIFTPGDLICRRGEVAREMFIIADGVVEVLSDRGTVLTSMSSGDFFGEIGILNLHGGINRRTADVRSLGYSELFVLSREDVLAALKDQPDAEHIIRECGEKRLKEIEAHNKKNSDPTPTPSPGSAPKTLSISDMTQNSLQVGPVKKNKPLRMSNLDKNSSEEKESPKGKTSSISKRLRDLPLGRSITMATSSGSGSTGYENRFQRLWKNNWSKMFSTRKGGVDGESRNVRGTGSRSGEKRRQSSSSSSSSPEARTRKHGVTFSQDADGSKGGLAIGGVTADTGSLSGRSTGYGSKKTLSNRLSSIMNQRKISHGTRYSAVRLDTSDSDSASHTDSASQPLTKPQDISKNDCPVADRRVSGFAGLLSAAGFRKSSPAKTTESITCSKQPIPHISLTVSTLHSSKDLLGQSSSIQTGDVVVDTVDPSALGQSTPKIPPLSATILMEDVDDDTMIPEINNAPRAQQHQYPPYMTTTTTNFTALTNAHGPVAGSVPSLPSSMSTIRGPMTGSSSVHTFGPSSRGSSSNFSNPARSATTHSFTSSPSSFYPGTGSGSGASTVTSRPPPITQSYSFSSSSSPSFYPGGGVGHGSTCSSSTPNVHHITPSLATPVGTSTTAKTTPTTTTAMTVTSTATSLISAAPISGNKFSLLAGRRRGPQQTPGLRSCSLDEYRTSTSSSDVQPPSHLATSSSSVWSSTPAAPPPSCCSSYSVSSSPMHPQVNRWIPGSGSTQTTPLGLTTRSSAITSIENGSLLGQTANLPNDAGGKNRKETNTTERQWQANQVIKDIQRILDEKITELQHVYQDSLEQYANHVRRQEDRIRDLERQLKNLQTL